MRRALGDAWESCGRRTEGLASATIAGLNSQRHYTASLGELKA
jgi:hypothetical protein